MRISSMTSSPMSYLGKQNERNLSRSFQKLSSGRRINSAADDATGLAIAQKLLKQANGLDAGTYNAKMSQGMINVAEGAMGSINDSLQRIDELSIKAANGTNSASDRDAIQMEIDQLKESISGIASQTKFNETNVLGGGSSQVASGADGSGMSINMPKFSTESLGIADYSVAGANYKLNNSSIGSALQKINSSRSYLGASSNRLDRTMAYNANTVYNLSASRSRIEDTDYAKGVTELKKNQLMSTYNAMLQSKYMNSQSGRVKQFF